MIMRVIRSIPRENVYFKEEDVNVGNIASRTERGVINVFEEFKYQKMLGFGGAFTEAAAYNYSLLSDAQKKEFMEKYFDRENGIGYNFCRSHINSCDFSIDLYTYVEDGDKTLDSFNIDRDRKYIIPFIKDALKYTGDELFLFASPWSPPAYMKDNESPFRGGSLKEEYKSVWARYYAKYIQEFAKEGIKISAITIQNEPWASQSWESCFYTAENERDFIEKYLAPALDAEDLSDIKIIIWDHNKERVYDRTKKIFESKAVEERVWAVGHHWYSGDHFDGMRLVHEKFGKVILSTENCGVITEDPIVLAEKYVRELCGDFNNFTSGLCDWNLLLNEFGGPFHNRDKKEPNPGKLVYENKGIGCYAPIIYDSNDKKLIYTPIYYYIGHFSKYVRRGAHRIATTKYSDDVQVCAFENPNGEIVLVIANISDDQLPAVVRHNDVCTNIDMPAHSIITVII